MYSQKTIKTLMEELKATQTNGKGIPCSYLGGRINIVKKTTLPSAFYRCGASPYQKYSGIICGNT